MVADGHRLSVRVQRTVYAFARERAALKDASSTVVIVSVSVPELKVGGGWATRAGGSKARPLPNVPEGHLNAVNRKMAFWLQVYAVALT